MRVPKFRVWDKISKKMFPVGIIDYSIQSIYIEEPNGMYCERDFDEVELMQFTDSELEMPYEESGISKEEIISGMEQIMHIASFYSHPSVPDVDDWGAVSSIAEIIYEELKNG